MKHSPQTKSFPSAILWKSSLILLITLFSLPLWAAKDTGYDIDLGFIKDHNGAAIRTNYSLQTTRSLNFLQFGAEIKLPLYYAETKDVEFAAAGLLVGGRAGIKIGFFEPYVAANFGPNAVLYLSDEEGPSFPLSRSLDYVLKFRVDRETAIYMSYNKTYNLMKRSIGTFGIGVTDSFRKRTLSAISG